MYSILLMMINTEGTHSTYVNVLVYVYSYIHTQINLMVPFMNWTMSAVEEEACDEHKARDIAEPAFDKSA